MGSNWARHEVSKMWLVVIHEEDMCAQFVVDYVEDEKCKHVFSIFNTPDPSQARGRYTRVYVCSVHHIVSL
jgi:hypothetical protein